MTHSDPVRFSKQDVLGIAIPYFILYSFIFVVLRFPRLGCHSSL